MPELLALWSHLLAAALYGALASSPELTTVTMAEAGRRCAISASSTTFWRTGADRILVEPVSLRAGRLVRVGFVSYAR